MTIDTDGQRGDLHLTSTGRGHEDRGRLIFPPVDFQRSLLNQLPTPLCKENKSDAYITSTGSAHDYKSQDISEEKYIYRKAAGNWKVNYVEDTIQKLQAKPQRKPLTMGYQNSEMQSQFQGKSVIPVCTRFSSGLQPPLYSEQHNEVPMKKLFEDDCDGYNKLIDRGIFNYHGDMYLTTTQKDHRKFTQEEKSKYPKKQFATYWECEAYPKAWGHGSKHNPLPVDSIPREKGPMRDHTWFKASTNIPRIPKPLQPVPNYGLCSEVNYNYKDISEQKRNDLFHCPVPTPWELTSPGHGEILCVPYKTDYQCIASAKPVMIVK